MGTRVDNDVKQYILRHYDSKQSGKRGEIDLVEWDAFVREEHLSGTCRSDGVLTRDRPRFDLTSGRTSYYSSFGAVKTALRIAPKTALLSAQEIREVHAAVCRLQHRVAQQSAAKRDRLTTLQREDALARMAERLLDASKRLQPSNPFSGVDAPHLNGQFAYLDPHFRTTMNTGYHQAAPATRLESVVIPRRAPKPATSGQPTAAAPESPLQPLGTLYVGDDRASPTTNDPETVRAANKQMPAQKFFITTSGTATTIQLVLELSSVDWVPGVADVVQPSRIMVVPSDYRGVLPPTSSAMQAWAMVRRKWETSVLKLADHFHTFTPTRPGAHRLELALPAGEYRIIAEAGRKARAEDSRDNFTVKILGRGAAPDTDRELKTMPVEDFTTRVVKVIQCPEPKMSVEVVFALDTSGSMSMARLVVAPSIEKILSTLRERGHPTIRFGSLTFSDWDFVHIHQPLHEMTGDETIANFRHRLMQLSDAGGDGEPIGRAMHMAQSLFSTDPEVCRAIIVLTDEDALQSFGWTGKPRSLYDGTSFSILEAVEEAEAKKVAVDIQLAITTYRDTPPLEPRPTAPFVVQRVFPAGARTYQGHTVESVMIGGRVKVHGGREHAPAMLVVEYLDDHYSVSLWQPTTVVSRSPSLSVWQQRFLGSDNLGDSNLNRLQWRRAFPTLPAVKVFLEKLTGKVPPKP